MPTATSPPAPVPADRVTAPSATPSGLEPLRSDLAPVSILGLPKYAEAELVRNGFRHVCDLVPEFAEGRIPLNKVRYFATKRKRDEVYTALRLRAVRASERLGVLRFFFLRNQVLHYFLVPAAVALVLLLTPHGQFDRDEWCTVLLVLFSLVVFDSGRWVREPASADTPFTSGRVRIVIVFCAFGFARLTLTDEFGNTEWLRVVILAIICAVWEGARTYFRNRLTERTEPQESIETPPSISATRGGDADQDSPGPRKGGLDRFAEYWNKQSIKVQLAIITGFFSLASTFLGGLLKLVSSVMNIGPG